MKTKVKFFHFFKKCTGTYFFFLICVKIARFDLRYNNCQNLLKKFICKKLLIYM